MILLTHDTEAFYLLPHSLGSPLSLASAWGITDNKVERFSRTPFGLPGRLIMRE